VTIWPGDALEVLRTLPDASVHMCATSPPFYGLRDYGVDGQIGLEETPEEWVDRLVAVFREVRRVLRDDGTLWVEIGDSYNGSGGYAGPDAPANRRRAQGEGWGRLSPSSVASRSARRGVRLASRKPKDMLGQPWMLAQALRDPYYTGRIRNERDRVWLAAILDGEGCISLHKRSAGQNAHYQPKVEITNTNRAIMDHVVAIAGGNCDMKQEAGTHGRKQTIYRWTVAADKARDLLRELYPHLVGKQHEARLAHGCPSSGDDASEAHESLKALHRGEPATIDFAAPETMWEAGWFLRSEIIWARIRPNPMPESVTDRPTKAHSTVFLLTKKPRYFYDADALRTPLQHDGRRVDHVKQGAGSIQHRDGPRWPDNDGANARSVWTIPTEPTPFAHFATWPRELVRLMIAAGTSERGCCPTCRAPWRRHTEVSYTKLATNSRPVGWFPTCTCEHGGDPVPCTVLDPFGGSGTTGLVARNMGRHAVLIELSTEYCGIAAERLAQQSLLAEEFPFAVANEGRMMRDG
jgi:DNA modification methylase